MPSNDLMEWLGPAVDELTTEQIERVKRVARDIDERYPDPDEQPQRDAALSAVVQYLLRETTSDEVSRALAAARHEESLKSAAAQWHAVMLHEDGMGEIPAAKACGITRTTLRRAMGLE